MPCRSRWCDSHVSVWFWSPFWLGPYFCAPLRELTRTILSLLPQRLATLVRAVVGLDRAHLRGRDVARRHHPISLEVQLEDRRLPDLPVIHLALGLGTAVQQDPGRLQGVGMADQ